MKTKRKSLWRLRTYDLWADCDGGYSVNDVYDQGLVTLTLHLKTNNQGTPREFKSWDITDRALNRILRIRGVKWYGDMPCHKNESGFNCALYGDFTKGRYAGSPAAELIFEKWC